MKTKHKIIGIVGVATIAGIALILHTKFFTMNLNNPKNEPLTKDESFKKKGSFKWYWSSVSIDPEAKPNIKTSRKQARKKQHKVVIGKEIKAEEKLQNIKPRSVKTININKYEQLDFLSVNQQELKYEHCYHTIKIQPLSEDDKASFRAALFNQGLSQKFMHKLLDREDFFLPGYIVQFNKHKKCNQIVRIGIQFNWETGQLLPIAPINWVQNLPRCLFRNNCKNINFNPRTGKKLSVAKTKSCTKTNTFFTCISGLLYDKNDITKLSVIK